MQPKLSLFLKSTQTQLSLSNSNLIFLLPLVLLLWLLLLLPLLLALWLSLGSVYDHPPQNPVMKLKLLSSGLFHMLLGKAQHWPRSATEAAIWIPNCFGWKSPDPGQKVSSLGGLLLVCASMTEMARSGRREKSPFPLSHFLLESLESKLAVFVIAKLCRWRSSTSCRSTLTWRGLLWSCWALPF